MVPARGLRCAARCGAVRQAAVRHGFVRPSREGLPVAAEAVMQRGAAHQYAARAAALQRVPVEGLPAAVPAAAQPRVWLRAQEARGAASGRPRAGASAA